MPGRGYEGSNIAIVTISISFAVIKAKYELQNINSQIPDPDFVI